MSASQICMGCGQENVSNGLCSACDYDHSINDAISSLRHVLPQDRWSVLVEVDRLDREEKARAAYKAREAKEAAQQVRECECCDAVLSDPFATLCDQCSMLSPDALVIAIHDKCK